MTPTAGTLWKIMGVMGYEVAVCYDRLFSKHRACRWAKTSRRMNAPWQMVMRSVLSLKAKRETVSE